MPRTRVIVGPRTFDEMAARRDELDGDGVELQAISSVTMEMTPPYPNADQRSAGLPTSLSMQL